MGLYGLRKHLAQIGGDATRQDGTTMKKGKYCNTAYADLQNWKAEFRNLKSSRLVNEYFVCVKERCKQMLCNVHRNIGKENHCRTDARPSRPVFTPFIELYSRLATLL